MSGYYDTNDRESKRWVIGLVLACLVCAGWVVHGVVMALRPESANAHKSSSAAADKTFPNSDFSDLSSPVTEESKRMYTPIPTNFIERVLTPDQARAEYVHKQAAWLRQMAKDPGARKAIGCLTPAQIDEMEKNGITIN